jgi:hypothetical protein
MAGMDGMRALLPTAALLLGTGSVTAPAASIGTTENTQYLPVWIADEVGSMPRASALLNLPPGWSSGDAVTIVAPGGAWPPGQRDRLVAALLDAGAAVLEPNVVRPGLPREAAMDRMLIEALRTAQEALGAGLVVAVGRDEGGSAALRAAEEAKRAGGAEFAAAVRLGPGAPVFHPGRVGPGESWPARATLFCDLLASVSPAEEAALGSSCQTSLAALR